MLKRLLRVLLLSVVVAIACGAYVAAPFYTAWSIREAIKANDSAYLEGKISWPEVRVTLKESLSAYALTSQSDIAAPSENPTWWQRTKAYFGKGAIDRFVETTVTPTGLHSALSMRRSYQSTFTPEGQTERSIFERVRRLWSRVTRAEFTRLDRLDLAMIDKYEPGRTIVCALELKPLVSGWGFHWVMTELRIKPTDKTQAKVQLALD